MKKIKDFCRSKPSAALGAFVILLLVLIAIFADVLAPTKMELGALPSDILFKLKRPYWALSELDKTMEQANGTIYWLGTDNLGRDVLSYLIYGARTSVILCLGVSVLTTFIAMVIGTLSAVIGGWFDLIVQRVVDAFSCIPGMLLSMILMSMVGNGIWQLIFVMSLPGGLGGTVMMEASMNFLGYGVKVGTPSWGYMITNQGRANMYAAPHLCMYPGICIAVMVLAANLFGDGLRDYLDPKLQGGVGTYDTKKIQKLADKYRREFEKSCNAA